MFHLCFPKGILVTVPWLFDFKRPNYYNHSLNIASTPMGKNFAIAYLEITNLFAIYFLTFQITCSLNLQNIGARQPNWCSAKKVIESVIDLKHLSFEKPRASQNASLPCHLSNLIQYLLFFYNLAAKHQITNMFDYFRLLFPQAWCLFLCTARLSCPLS